MNKTLAVARAEYLQAIRSKAFLIGVLAMPLIMGGSIVVQLLLKDQVDLTERTCAVVDPTGELWPVIEQAAETRNEEGIWEDDDGERKQRRPRIVFERHVPQAGEQTELLLSERVRDGELSGFLILGEAVLNPDAEVGERPADYHTDTPTFTELPDWLEGVINSEARRVRFEAADLNGELVAKLGSRVNVGTFGLASKSAEGQVEAGERENKGRTFGVPAGAMFLLFMLIMTSAPALMNQILEEKMQRISEVLVSAVSPFQLMMGKLMGGAFVSGTLGVLYVGAVAWATHHYGIGDFVPLSIYIWFFVLMLVALLMYGSVFSALGSACSELRDAQSMMMPAMMMIMIPLFAWTAILEAPNGTVARVLTFVPTATPMVLMLRVASAPGPPMWEVVVSMLFCLATTVFFVWASSKVFRIGVLSQGQAPSFRALIGWVFAK
jgi:ABC-2 type transport system permease protein